MADVQHKPEMDLQLQAIKQELLKRKQELEEQIVELSEQKVSEDLVKDSVDQAVTASMELLQSTLQDREIHEYNMILDVLNKIEDGTYGICVDCIQPISPKRLKVYPNATRCITCQEALEQ